MRSPSGVAGIALASFERASTDTTIEDDGVAERWSAAAGTFIAAGATLTRDGGTSVKSGSYRLRVTLGSGANTGTEWSLDGTFKASRTYKARVWVDPAGQTITAKLGVAASSATASVSGTGWQPLDLGWTPDSDQTAVKLAMYRAATGSGVDVLVDNAAVWDDGEPDRAIPTETAYDDDGRVIASVIVPGAFGTAEQPLVTLTAYDPIGRVTQVTANAITGAGTGDTTSNLATATAYDALSRVETATDPTGTVTRFGYDRLGRLTATTLNYLDGTASGELAADDVKSTFAYNAAGELTGSCSAVQVYTGGCDPADPAEAQAWRYQYDAAGNLARQTPPDNTTQTDLADARWEYDAGGRLTKTCALPAAAADCTAGSVLRNAVPAYDHVGRVTRLDTRTGSGTTLALRGETDYRGDGQPDEVRSYEGSGATLVDTLGFGYDELGRQIALTRDGTTTLAAATYNPDGTLEPPWLSWRPLGLDIWARVGASS